MSVEAKCREAAKRLANVDFVRIVSDDDADGLAAAGVMTRALSRNGIPFHLSLGRMEPEDYAALEAHDNVLLMDMGAGDLDKLAHHPGEVVVLDHHVVRGRAPRVHHVNPNLEGQSGTGDCSAASLAFQTALFLDPENADLAPIAFAGIIGDRQHVPRLTGTNAGLAQRAVSGGALAAERGLPFAPDLQLDRALTSSVDPFLVGLAGSARHAHDFLEALELPPEARVDALGPRESRRLASALAARLLAQGAEPRIAEEVAGRRYTGTLVGRTVSSAWLAGVFNACARAERPGLAVAIAHGDAHALQEAESLLDEYEEAILKGLLQLARNPPEALDHIQFFDAPMPELAGAHCGLGMSYVFPKDKPTLALQMSDEFMKVSSRATQALVDAGLDLAEAMNVAASEHGGAGGGHPIAAGARVPAETRDAFLARVDAIVGGQLGD